ncbi:glycosyl transferase [Aureococcus anophagefferens]|nr:glycosyl transferase [Aureococcus anophagefferens]
MGKECGSCGVVKELGGYTSVQWRLGAGRRCKRCFQAAMPLTPKAEEISRMLPGAVEGGYGLDKENKDDDEDPAGLLVEDAADDGFVEAAAYGGPKPGYYFGRAGGRLGYHVDPHQASRPPPPPGDAAVAAAPAEPEKNTHKKAAAVDDVLVSAELVEEDDLPGGLSPEEAAEALLDACLNGDKGALRRVWKAAGRRGRGSRLWPDAVTKALQAAVALGHASTVRVLHELGADLRAEGATGMTALQLACFKGADKVVRVLAELDPPVDEDLWTDVARLVGAPLHIAAFYGHRDGHAKALALLVERKACINGATRSFNKKQSPLYIACQHNHVEVVHTLVAYGADLSEFPLEDEELGRKENQNECGKFIKTVVNHGGWKAYQDWIYRNRPRPGVEIKTRESTKLNLPKKNFRNMG